MTRHAQARWQANADEIAVFLAAANPGEWPRDEMAATSYQLTRRIDRLERDNDSTALRLSNESVPVCWGMLSTAEVEKRGADRQSQDEHLLCKIESTALPCLPRISW